MQPAISSFDEVGLLEGFTHQASLIIIRCEPLQKEGIYEILASEKNLEFGVTEIFPTATIVRILGYGSEQLYDCMQKIADAIDVQKIQLTGK